jgi:hypothetical protein
MREFLSVQFVPGGSADKKYLRTTVLDYIGFFFLEEMQSYHVILYLLLYYSHMLATLQTKPTSCNKLGLKVSLGTKQM